MEDVIIRVEDVRRYYELGKNNIIKALDGMTCSILHNSYVSILGPSGSGKSTLFNIIGGLDRATSGTVLVDGEDLSSMDDGELAYIRCMRIGYIFQTYNLILSLTALQNVAIPMAFANMEEKESIEKAASILEMVGLGDRLDHIPEHLSGGQQQRVAIARALANDPSIILADEPTGNLDVHTGEEIIVLLRELRDKFGVTVVTATHDLKMISKSDYVMWIRDGRMERLEKREYLKIDEGHL